MDGKKHAVAELENQQNLAKKTKAYISRILAPKGGGREAVAPLWWKYWPDVGFLFLFSFLQDFVDFHILPQHVFGHPFCNLKGCLGMI